MMSTPVFHCVCCVLVLIASATTRAQSAEKPAASDTNVVMVLVDGVRTEEMFGGADERLLNKEAGGVSDVDALRKQYWRETPEERRAVLLPFLWGTVAKKGQVFGNRERSCPVQVANTFWFSYPGYSEMMVGYADPKIDSNDPKPNPNVTVFEWLNKRPGFQGRVAAFGAWDTVTAILNRERCGFFVNAGFEPVPDEGNPQLQLLNRLKSEVPSPWAAEPYDALTFHSALEYLKQHKPRVLLITFGETDELGHEGRYDHYLQAATRTDGFLKTLWATLQSLPAYKDRTTLLVTSDHGRGSAPGEWRTHGNQKQGSQYVWQAVIGPRTPALGERANLSGLHLAQVAATVAVAVGEDYAASDAKLAPALPGALR